MKYPISLRDSTPYYEKHFLLCDDSPNAYVAAYREAQLESRAHRRRDLLAAASLTLIFVTAWAAAALHLLFMLLGVCAVWSLHQWRNQHEKRLLERTFELALRGKDPVFCAYMWRYRDRLG